MMNTIVRNVILAGGMVVMTVGTATASEYNTCYGVYEKYTHPHSVVEDADKRVVTSSTVACAKGARKAWDEVRKDYKGFEYYDRFLMSNLSRLLTIARGK